MNQASDMTARAGCARFSRSFLHRNSGFTLVEVLVALVVAAILASSLLVLQQHGLNQARETDLLWLHLNMAQEGLMGRDLVQIQDHSEQHWRLSASPPSSERPGPWITLTTTISGRDMDWSWPAIEP
jgi:prepilin-type N-terminal cleavage/methylation domain-containing protein